MMYAENKMGCTLLQEILSGRMASEGEGRMEGNMGLLLLFEWMCILLLELKMLKDCSICLSDVDLSCQVFIVGTHYINWCHKLEKTF